MKYTLTFLGLLNMLLLQSQEGNLPERSKLRRKTQSTAQGVTFLEQSKNMTVHQFSKRIRKANLPLLICFSADTSNASLAQKKILEEIASDHSTELEIVLIDMLDNPKISRHFEITSVPILILYIQRYPVWLRIGLLEKENILSFIEPYRIKL